MDGSFATPFDPIEMGHTKQWRDFIESDSWQTSFGVQHDPAGLIGLYAGEKPCVAKLDGLFRAVPDLPPDAPPDIAGMVGQYAHGNEPSHHQQRAWFNHSEIARRGPIVLEMGPEAKMDFPSAPAHLPPSLVL